ncbi:MAG: hydrogenase maturation protease, partial [Acidimicrobiia bacterium]|nr:hydrogenase maturation protease [Acidimicrobiia bacterium]
MSEPSKVAPALIVGVGNPSRGDDAVGPLVIESFRHRLGSGSGQIATKVLTGDLVDLVLSWRSDQDVVVVDAMMGGAPPGTIVETDGFDHLPLPRGAISSHGVGITEAVNLARLLDRLPRSLTIIGVEAGSFGHFEPPSRAVKASIPEVVDRLIERFCV